ncbi:hypothetical protein [Streptomyces peucetius]|uniref:Integral membrane protein n=1 Tax=Streptomyces peucetius TaxID=1950 RepID=A0ABY6I185_STRPE|nr:hypothetical protein [Streptomyces peucetius]UYQ60719.1 hypothetical protein OGH68_04075 [Streptomyces peucetius]
MSPATRAPRSGGPALELLVHGVGGATPQDMLGDPRTVRMTGDEKAAVYRRTDDARAESDPDAYRDRPIPEAYCWSNLTSGNGARALWLLLLPFMVVNLAHWMRPRAAGMRRTTRFYGALVRLVALSLTVLLTAAACEVALDLLAWQCAGSAACSGERSWLGFMSAAQGGWWSQPGRRLALASAVPAALVGLLWYLSNRTWSAYEAQRPPTGEADGDGDDDEDEVEDGAAVGDDGDAVQAAAPAEAPPVRSALGRPGFWYGRRLVARLRAAHTAAGILTVAAAVAGAAARHDRAAQDALLKTCGVLLEGALVAGAAAVLWVVCHRGRSERRVDARLDRAAVRGLPGAALVLLALSLLYASWSRPGWASSATLPGEVTFRVIVLAQGGLVVTLALAAWLLHRRARHPRTVLYGLAGPAVAMLACALGGVMTGGVAQRVADWIDGPGTPGMDGEGAIPGPPVLLSWQASVIPVLLAVLLVPALVLVARTWLAARRLAPRVEAEYFDGTPGEGRRDAVRTRRIASTRARAALTDVAPLMVGVVSGATLLLGAGAVGGSWLTGEVPGRSFADGGLAEPAARAAQAMGSWLVGFGFVLFVTMGRRAYRDASARRTIGILWDVGTFWPRAAHPFAPPCYAERAVPDLTWRMCTWTERTGGRLVISGHSQGSVLAAAAVWQLPTATRRRVALLTYGSPLERLYGRWFPAYFGPKALLGLSRELDCWRNLWRRTDPIGGPMLIAGEQIHAGAGCDDPTDVDRDALKDPVVYGRTQRHPLPEPILGHSGYQADPMFAEERAALLDRLTPTVPRQAQGSSGRSSA